MKTSVILTINNRTPEVSQQVADSFRLEGNQPDEIIVVLDRPTQGAQKGAQIHYPPDTNFVHISGEPGWLGPAKAWNAGFKAATGDLLYCISSEVVQEAFNLQKARELAESHPNTAIFGACHNSKPSNLVVGAESDPGVLVSTRMVRPLGFIVAMPAAKVREINGFDETFMDGFWFDDDDFFYRLWTAGMDFLFTDDIHGTHLDHARPDLETPEGHRKIAINRERMIKKHGRAHVWNDVPHITGYGHNQVSWIHL